MRFSDIKRFAGAIPEDAVTYLNQVLGGGLRDLYIGLSKLEFKENFETFIWEGDIAASGTSSITNVLGRVPSYRLIARAIPLTAGTVIIDDSTSAWTESVVYLRNSGTANARIKAVFFK